MKPHKNSIHANVDIAEARVLIVDDEWSNVLLLEGILEDAGYVNVRSTTRSSEVEHLCQNFEPDLMLLDLMMPPPNGFQILEQLSQAEAGAPFLPVIVLTADINPETKERALSGGAHDFLTKPFDYNEVLLRIRNLLTLHFVHGQLHHQNLELERRVKERTQELEASHRALEASQIEVIERLAHAAEYRDDDTGQHTQRVGVMASLLAEALGLPPEHAALIRRAAPMHDVGKIGIPDAILLKPGRLTPEEFSVMKTHATIGANLLADGRWPLIQMAEVIARSHHERWDGTGYPNGLTGEAIPLEGRIVAVVDVFDALTHERPYKTAWTIEAAIEEIRRQSGKQFDPIVVERFLELPLEGVD